MTPQEQAHAVRQSAGLFRLADRGLLRVTGGDRVRWLDGMLSNDVASLEPGPDRSGCYAALLTRQGRIVCDFHVLQRGDGFWLETARDAVATALETLDRFVIADDVTLADASDEVERIGLEGPSAPVLLEAALGAPLPLGEDCCAEVELAGVPVLAAAFGWSGAPGRQLFVPSGSGDAVAAALRAARGDRGLVEAGAEVLEILRVEAGVPKLGAELDQEVLPAEARLERAVSYTKGCYTGQEVVARMHSRGRVGHLLVGLRLEGGPAGEVGADVEVEGRKTGEVTSACLSPSAGSIALAFVRAQHAEPGTAVSAGGRPAQVAELPFIVGAPA